MKNGLNIISLKQNLSIAFGMTSEKLRISSFIVNQTFLNSWFLSSVHGFMFRVLRPDLQLVLFTVNYLRTLPVFHVNKQVLSSKTYKQRLLMAVTQC